MIVLIFFFGFFGLSRSSQAADYYGATTGNDSDNGSLGSPWRTINKALSACLLPLAMLCVSSAQAATYYVDQTHPGANDANSGTQTLPWKTIQKAADTLAAGDTALVMSGTYPERITIPAPKSGTAGSPITFKASPRRSVVMQGFHVTANYIRIEGFDISTSMGGWNGGGVWIAGNNLEILDNYFHDIPGPAVSFSWSFSWAGGAPGLWHDIYIARNRIYRCNMGLSIRGRNIVAEDNEIERLIYTSGDADNFRFFGENITIRRSYMHGTQQSEIGPSHTDGFQTFDNNGEFAQHVLIENNILTGFYHQGFMGEAAFHGNSFDITFRNNIFEGSQSWGLAISDRLRDVKAYNNVFANITNHGVGLTNGAQGEVYNNIFFNGGSNYWADDTSTLTAGGYNLISKSHYPNYKTATDLVDIDPRFVDPANLLGNDGLPFTADDGFHLQSNSPAIDAGVDLRASGMADDADRILRPQGPAWDIGAYEFVSGVPDTTPPSAPRNFRIR